MMLYRKIAICRNAHLNCIKENNKQFANGYADRINKIVKDFTNEFLDVYWPGGFIYVNFNFNLSTAEKLFFDVRFQNDNNLRFREYTVIVVPSLVHNFIIDVIVNNFVNATENNYSEFIREIFHELMSTTTPQ